MDIKKDFKNGVRLVADAASDITQTMVEKSRLRAKANRIKQIIKGDTELRNQAYIELGRYFYDNLRENADTEQEALCVIIDKTTARIDKASRKYLELTNCSKDLRVPTENTDKIKQAVSDKATKIKDSTEATVQDIKDKAKQSTKKAKEKASDLGDKAKVAAQDLSAKAKETVADLSDKAKDKVDDFKSFIAPDEDLEDFINENDDLQDMIEQQQEIIAVAKEEALDAEAEIEVTDDEESPEEFEF